ncbi:MAG TPA: choice-of-anchor tandem repeat GloVer-containing protein [Candidatus Acidoferrum sp.]|jgi:uncharacterized repeat protein (TIGR03803 family)|nr:choice-of-anchor tandem repeat GloVer-containing protein [Candidatus Acidoferrum sp.]
MSTTLRFTIARFFAAAAIALTLTSVGWTQSTEKILHTFTGSSDGSVPEAGMTLDSQGNLYGTTAFGGAFGCCGTVFELSPASNGTWTEKLIYDFSLGGGADGFIPWGGLVFDNKGNLYGTTLFGGTSFQGTVFELTPGANGTWTESVLYSFTGGADGGSLFGSSLIIDGSGNLYGTAESGGAYGYGVVFEMVAGSNGTWTQKVLHSFKGGNDGTFPFNNPLVMDPAGKLYGATLSGGAHDYGIVYQLTPESNGTWAEKLIYPFTSAGVSGPAGNLVLDSAGNLYSVCAFCIFELMPGPNGTWTEKTLYTFQGGPDGAYPEAVVSDKAGNLFGTTYSGGVHHGTVFELSHGANGTWSERVLHRFQPDGVDGVFPQFATLAIDASGNLYGTTPSGGTSAQGVVFEITH